VAVPDRLADWVCVWVSEGVVDWLPELPWLRLCVWLAVAVRLPERVCEADCVELREPVWLRLCVGLGESVGLGVCVWEALKVVVWVRDAVEDIDGDSVADGVSVWLPL
jgi:hypothetical protein